MKCLTRTIIVCTNRGPEFVDITDRVAAIAREASLQSGFAIVFSRHTTAAIRINENEPMLIKDMEQLLEKVASAQAYYNHNDCANGVDSPPEGGPNGHAHCQQLLLGASEAVPIAQGDLVLGQWQRLFLVELDQGREREVVIQLVGE